MHVLPFPWTTARIGLWLALCALATKQLTGAPPTPRGSLAQPAQRMAQRSAPRTPATAASDDSFASGGKATGSSHTATLASNVTKDDGPWLIMATSFPGEEGLALAQTLVKELQADFRLRAYTHIKYQEATPPSGRRRTLGQDMRPKISEVAVLIGDFEAVDDPQAQKVLKRVKYDVRPKCLSLDGQASGVATNNPFTAMRSAIKDSLTEENKKRQKGPLGHAFIIPNPLLPREFFAPQGVDKFVESMNRDVKYSLLDNPGKYTVKVATFRGAGYFTEKEIAAAEEDGRAGRRLAEAERNANLLTIALRDRGVEAYEFHDRDESIVTVGSFKQLGRPQADGSVDYASGIKQLFIQFSAERKALRPEAKALLAKMGQGGMLSNIQPKTLLTLFPQERRTGALQPADIIPFDVTPAVIEVPQRSLAKDYRSRLGLR